MQQRQTAISLWCDRLLEGCWLLALVLIPNYFNLLSARHFEPDKATSLRAIVTLMVAVALVGWIERLLQGGGSRAAPDDAGPPEAGLLTRAWRRLRAVPLALPTLIYALVFLLASALSITPRVSLWGSYQRLQGTYTNFAYITLAVMIVLHLRRREQLDRLVTVAILGSLGAVGYGLLQHLQLDPLPWKGDVVSRVASTMGNSIFVAAYLIMVVPLTLYRAIAGLWEGRRTPAESGRGGAQLAWAGAYLLFVLGSLLIMLAAVQFGAVVRVADLRYWWVLPGAIVVAVGLYILPTLRLHSAERIGLGTLAPGILALLYALMLGLSFSLGGTDQRVQPSPGRPGAEWPLWLIGGTVLVLAGYVLCYLLPRRSGPARLLQLSGGVGMLLVALLQLLTIFFTQSRGPWVGAGVGLFVFFTLLLIQAYRGAKNEENRSRARLWGGLLAGEVLLALALAGFIVVFNYSDAPVFKQLREVPYIGRMGRLLDVSAGTTGDVRMKIWFGDEKAGGVMALITADPFRTVFGWGPESMFVAYNKFYPPSLANVESRGASPDRSHEAYLDELVTKGVVGLISYLFVILSFLVLAWRLATRSAAWPTQVFFIACISTVVAHSFEGLTGIPIVATLMMLWVTMAITVVGGALAGHYSLDRAAPAAEPAPAEETETGAAAARPPAQQQRNQRRRPQPARGSAARAAVPRRSSQSNPARLAIYVIVLVFGLLGVWFLNVDNVYADMRFQQSQLYTDNPQSGLDQQLVGMGYLLEAIQMEPEQDFYYLNLGRNLMSIADIRRQMQNTPMGQEKKDAFVEDLLNQPSTLSAQQFVIQQGLLDLMSYTRSVLRRAYDLSPDNKDNSANLARLHSFWYSRFDANQNLLQGAITWYGQAHKVAPQDVAIMNEYAGAVALQANYFQSRKDQANADAAYNQAEQLLRQAKQLDPRYTDTDLRLGELQRVRGQYAQAVDTYLALLDRNPRALNAQVATLAASLQSQPDQLARLRDRYKTLAGQNASDGDIQGAYGTLAAASKDLESARAAYSRQVQLLPQNLDAHRNYTLVLSDSAQYQQAASEAQNWLNLAQQLKNEQATAQAQSLLQYLKAKAGS